jgi:uncharacterized membrane protein
MRMAGSGGSECDLQPGDCRVIDVETGDEGMGRAPVAGVALAMVLLALSAPWLTIRHPAAALAIRGFFSRLCHQDPARSFAIGGSPVAVCVRCLGIYGGVAAGALLSGCLRWQRSTTLRCFFAGLLLNGADVAAEALRLHGNLPLVRLLFGALLGIAAGILLTVPWDRISLRRDDSVAFHPRTG